MTQHSLKFGFTLSKMLHSVDTRLIIILVILSFAAFLVPIRWVFAAKLTIAAQQRFVSIGGNDASTNNCSNQDNPCLTIGYALSKAVRNDSISVGPGTFTEDLVINKGIKLFGHNSILQGVNNNATDKHIVIAADDVEINGFTITDANSAGQSSPGANTQGIVIDNVTGVHIYGNTISDVFVDSVKEGTAVYLGANISDVILEQNLIANSGNGVFFNGSGARGNFIHGNRFSGNGRGGILGSAAIRFSASSILPGHDNVVAFNSFIGSKQGIGINNESSTEVVAKNNWWGCNYGPGVSGTGCAVTTDGISGNVIHAPWLKLRLGGLGAQVYGGDLVRLLADVRFNSNGEDTSPEANTSAADGGRLYLNDSPIKFSANSGSVVVDASTANSTEVAALYHAELDPKIVTVTTALDGQSATLVIDVKCQRLLFTPLSAIGPEAPALLPDTFVGATYSQVFKLTQGRGPLTWSLVGSFPPGLIIDPVTGVLSGQPTQSGVFAFSVKATDSFGCSSSKLQSYQMVVNSATVDIADLAACTEPGNLVRVTVKIPSIGNTDTSNTFKLAATLPTTLRAIPGSCEASVGDCLIGENGAKVTWMGGPVEVRDAAFISYLAQVADGARRNEPLCIDSTITSTNGINQPGITIKTCKTVNCLPVGPGEPISNGSEISDQKSGSVLIYNTFTSSTDPTKQNTRINITNVHAQLPVNVHLFFVAEGCSVADSYLCLTGNQTASFLTSDFDPGVSGYLIVVAVDQFGCPRNFNYLVGDEYVKFASGHSANVGAIAFSQLAGGLPACDGNSVTATLNFDGVSYNRLPATLALDNVGSRADGNDTLLIVNRIGGNLGIGASTLGTLFGILYDDAENALSFNVTGGCQLRSSLSNNFPRTTPRFETFIPAGRTGWLKIFNQTGAIGMTGSAINVNSNAASSAGAFNRGHNLHALTLNSNSSYIIPIFPPSC